MFGDYQIINNHKSTECYTSDESNDTYLMCLKKKVLLDLLDKFPDASAFYKERARERRIEFRRVRYNIISEFY